MDNMGKLKILMLITVAVAAVSSCKSQYEILLNSNDADAKYQAAFKYFEEEKYSKAAALFESLSVLTNGTERDDTVQYYWGLSNYRFKDYYTAETNFAKFAESFPRSPFAPEARFLRLDCLYRATMRYELDQTPTYAAINAIEEYMAEFPGNSNTDVCKIMLDDLTGRLDTKSFEAARLYYKMEDYIASRVALRNVLKDDSENIHREEILYYIAMSSYKYAQFSVASKQKERYLVFVDDYLNFIGELPESPYRRELDVLYKRAQRAIGRYSADGSLADDGVKEKDFAKERRKMVKAEKATLKEAEELMKSKDGKAVSAPEKKKGTDVKIEKK